MARRTLAGTPGLADGTGEPSGGVVLAPGTTYRDVEPDGDRGGDGVVDPADVGTGSDRTAETDSGSAARKRRGRPRGSRNGRKAASNDLDVASLAEWVSEIHSMIAWATGTPELALDEASEEHVKLTRAATRVLRHYDIPAMSAEALDWASLVKVCAALYVPRIGAIAMRRKLEAAPKKPPPAASSSAPSPAAPQQRPPSQSVGVPTGVAPDGRPIYTVVDPTQLQ
jgi:hypothetical protein